MTQRFPALFLLLTGCFSTSAALPEPEAHRPEREAMCDDFRESPDFDFSMISGGCHSHEECTEGMNGRCTNYGRGYADCTYDQCFVDADCASGPCNCGDDYSGNTCRGGDCQIDADCGDAGFCSPTLGSCGDYSGVVAYYCHTPDDECTDDADCEGSRDGFGGAYCMYSPEVARWVCSDTHCAG